MHQRLGSDPNPIVLYLKSQMLKYKLLVMICVYGYKISLDRLGWPVELPFLTVNVISQQSVLTSFFGFIITFLFYQSNVKLPDV